MKAAGATRVPVQVLRESDSEEEVPLKRRPRVRIADSVLVARGERLKAASQGSLPPQRRTPPVPTESLPQVAKGRDEPMLAVGDIRLATQPTAWPAPQRPAPPIPTAGKPMPQAEPVVLKTQSPSLLERQRPAPISTARPPVAEPADTEAWHTAPNSPSQLASPSSTSSLSVPSSPSSMSSPSWPATPEAGSPVVAQREGKQPALPSPPASTSAAAPEATGPALPSERLRHLDKLAHVGELANQIAEPLDKLWGLRVPHLPPFHYMDRDALVDANRFLARHEHLLDMKDLRQAQDGLRDLLDNGVQEGRLPGVSEARLWGLRVLSEADLMSLTKALRQFKADYDDLYDVVVNVKGGNPNWFTRRARPIEDIEAERAARIAADNKALEAGHYTF